MCGGFNVENGYFDAFDDLKLFYRSWIPLVNNEEKVVIIGIHGGEVHSGNLKHVGEHFSNIGYPFYALDRRGHGKSDDKNRMFVKDYNLFIKDIKTFISFAKEKEGAEKVYVIGHSNGGGQAIITAVRHPELITKMILSAPSIKLYGNKVSITIQRILASFIGTIFPRFTFKSTLKPEILAKDKTIVEERSQDELIYGKFRARWVREIFRFQKDVNKNIHKLNVPTLFMIGTGDTLVDPYQTVKKFESIEQKGKMKLNIYEGYWHELFNELPEDRAKIFQDIEEFIKN